MNREIPKLKIEKTRVLLGFTRLLGGLSGGFGWHVDAESVDEGSL